MTSLSNQTDLCWHPNPINLSNIDKVPAGMKILLSSKRLLSNIKRLYCHRGLHALNLRQKKLLKRYILPPSQWHAWSAFIGGNFGRLENFITTTWLSSSSIQLYYIIAIFLQVCFTFSFFPFVDTIFAYGGYIYIYI